LKLLAPEPTPASPGFQTIAASTITDQKAAARKRGDHTERNRLQRAFKIRAKEDHEAFITRTVEGVEEGIKSNHLGPAFKAIKVLAGNKPAQAMPFVNKADGSPCTSPKETLHRWREHFTAALNHPPGTRSDDLDTEADTTTRDTDTPVDAPSLDETISAIRKLRNGRAAGPDGIPPELLKCTACNFHKCLEDWPHSRRLEGWHPDSTVQGKGTESRVWQLQANHLVVRTGKGFCTRSPSSHSASLRHFTTSRTIWIHSRPIHH